MADSALPGVRFRITASALALSVTSPPGRLDERDVAAARHALRKHFRDTLIGHDPTDPDGARDLLWSTWPPDSACRAVVKVQLRELVVELDPAARAALAEYDAAARASCLRYRAMASKVDFVHATLADPPRALAWLLGRDVNHFGTANLDEVLARLEDVAATITTAGASGDRQRDATGDPLPTLVCELVASVTYPLYQQEIAEKIAALCEPYGAADIARRVREAASLFSVDPDADNQRRYTQESARRSGA